jgi:hypothetical protein
MNNIFKFKHSPLAFGIVGILLGYSVARLGDIITAADTQTSKYTQSKMTEPVSYATITTTREYIGIMVNPYPNPAYKDKENTLTNPNNLKDTDTITVPITEMIINNSSIKPVNISNKIFLLERQYDWPIFPMQSEELKGAMQINTNSNARKQHYEDALSYFQNMLTGTPTKKITFKINFIGDKPTDINLDINFHKVNITHTDKRSVTLEFVLSREMDNKNLKGTLYYPIRIMIKQIEELLIKNGAYKK